MQYVSVHILKLLSKTHDELNTIISSMVKHENYGYNSAINIIL